MTFTGRTLGPYELGPLLGAGGMGEVYRATDTRLGRTVAVKVLPPEVTTTPERRMRFEREARAIAALSHPHICAIHDVGTAGDVEYLVMEYLEGETLAERIQRGPLPATQVLRYGVQIAEALAQAHRAGIVHRDLKPGNIMLTASGVKLLDFGLAKSVAAAQGGQNDVRTEITPLTSEHSIIGTLHYMSPEQVEGRALDQRTDIFALGVILYEMATGQRPFNGNTRTAVMSAIVSSDPAPLRALQPAVPLALERIITTALEKNPDDRWQTAHDVARQLRWLENTTSTSGESAIQQQQQTRRHVPMALVLIGVAALAALATWGAMKMLARGSSTSPPTSLELSTPPEITPASVPDVNPFALSPDGRALCFAGFANGQRALYVRDLGAYDVVKIEGSEDGAGPFWSSDGQWIGFSARGKLWKTKRSGNAPPEPLCDVTMAGAIASWAGDTILFGDAPSGRGEIYRVSASGGQPVAITKPARGEWRQTWPYLLPDGKRFIYLALSADTIDRQIILSTLDGAKRSVLLTNVSQVRLSGPDQLMFVRDGKLLAQHFDLDNGKAIGEAESVAGDVAYFYPSARADFDAVPAGVVIWRTDTHNGTLSIVDRAGNEKKVVDSGRFFDLSVAGDGGRAAVTVIDRGTGLGDVWLYDLHRGLRDRFTTDAGMEFSPVWSSDRRTIFYASAQGGTVPRVMRLDVGGSAPAVLTQEGRFRWPTSVTPDDSALYFVERNLRTKNDIFMLPLSGGQEQAVLSSEFNESDPRISPDGKWLAYSSDATGRREIYVRDATRRVRVSAEGGAHPRWSADGRELYYVSGANALSAARSASGNWDDAAAAPLLRTRAEIVDYAPLPDQTFIIIEETPGPRDSLFHLILGWH